LILFFFLSIEIYQRIFIEIHRFVSWRKRDRGSEQNSIEKNDRDL